MLSLEDDDDKQSDVPDIHKQQQARPSTPSMSENCVTPTLLSDKENCAELATSLDPVYPEIVRTPEAQKSVVTSQVKVLNSVSRSPLSELLVYPTCAKKKTEVKKYAVRVLTSAESIALLEEKKQKKLEEIEEKQRKKKEREMKKIAREEEKKRKALEREAKKAEAEKNKKNKGTIKKRPVKSSDTANPKRQKICEDECEEVGLQHREISESECAACFGHWEEDDADEWLMCTNEMCGVWSHTNCLEKSDDAYVCVLCQTCFL